MESTDWTGVIFGMEVLILETIILIVVLIVSERFYRARSQRRDQEQLTSLLRKYEENALLPRGVRSRRRGAGRPAHPAGGVERILREVE